MYLRNSQMSRPLPMPASPNTVTRRALPSRPVACSWSFSNGNSSSRPTNGGSRPAARPRPPRSATTRMARHAATGRLLPRSACSPAGSNAIAMPAARCVVSSTRTDPGARRPGAARCSPGRRRPCPGRPPRRSRRHRRSSSGTRRLAPSATRTSHGVDEVECRANGALGVVLVRDRRAEHGHHGIADELLDDPAVSGDHLARGIEVAGQELADLLGILRLGSSGEADEVGEQDGDEPTLRDRRRRDRGRRRACRGRAGNRRRQVRCRTRRRTWRRPGPALAHEGQPVPNAAPHSMQNLRPASLSLPQCVQRRAPPPRT